MTDFLMTYQWEAWLAASLIFLVLELMAGDFFMMCLAASAAVSAVVAALGGGFALCLAVFAVAAVGSLYFLRPRMIKRFARSGKWRKSNADALIGRKGIVKEEIRPAAPGYVAIDGDMWKSVAEGGGSIAAGTEVEVVSRDSIILTVKPVNLK